MLKRKVKLMLKKIFKGGLFFTIMLIVSYLLAIIFHPVPNVYHPYEKNIYSKNEELIYSQINNTYSNYCELKNISNEFINTLITIEDKSFYSHSGVDYKRVISSAFNNFKENEIIQGGSTITQQLARMIYLNNDKTLKRKFKELLISKKLEANYQKDKILEMYINLVYFGHDLYGINAASNYYFNKTPLDLSYNESAVLIGIINSPNNFAPDINLDKCLNKKNQILNSLVKNKIINDEEYLIYTNEKLSFYCKKDEKNGIFSYYNDAVNKEYYSLNINQNEIDKIGVNISTYLNENIQKNITDIVNNHHSYITNEELAIVVMKPNTNEVLSLIGGISINKSEFNRAIDSYRQIGSTIKPLIYYLGLEKGMNPNTLLTSQETTFRIEGFEDYSPKNAGEKYANRKINLIEAIGLSDNIYATKTAIYVGLNNIAYMLNKFHINNIEISPTLALGTIELSPLELTSIYNTFASKGIYYPPKFIKEIKDSRGYSVYNDSTISKRLLNETNTLILNYLLRSPFDESLISYTNPSLVNYQTKARFCAKTGTTESSQWVVGYNSDYTICIYVGTDNNEPLKNNGLAKKIFVDVADFLCPNENSPFFNVPSSCESFSLTNKLNSKNTFTYIRKK